MTQAAFQQPAPWPGRLKDYALLMRLHKPIGALLLLWPTLWALWLAGAGAPSPWIVCVFVVGVWIMRAAGCVINDFADRRLDPKVKRTRERPLAAGRVSPGEALALFVILCLCAFALVLTMNRLTVLLSIPGAALAAIYPFSKRYTHLPQVVLGAAFGWSIPMAFAAQTGHVPPLAWGLFAVNIVWSTAYDTFYAMVDRDDDLVAGAKSSAILFGRYDRLITGLLQAAVLLGLWLLGRDAGLGAVYDAGLVVAAGFAVYQQYLIRNRERAPCFRAFLNNNWFGAAVFAGMVLGYALA